MKIPEFFKDDPNVWEMYKAYACEIEQVMRIAPQPRTLSSTLLIEAGVPEQALQYERFIEQINLMHHHLQDAYISGEGDRRESWKNWVCALVDTFGYPKPISKKIAIACFYGVDAVHAYT